MNFFRSILFFLALISISFSASAIDKRTYTVGTVSNDFVALILFSEVESHFGIKFKYINYNNFSDGLAAVKSDEVDFMASVSYTDERSQWFEFSKPVNIDYTYVFTFDGNIDIDDVISLAIPKDSLFATIVPEQFPDISYYEYSTIEEAKGLLNARLVDGIIGSLFNIQEMLQHGLEAHLLDYRLRQYPVSLIAPKGKNQDVLKIIEEFATSPAFQVHLKSSVFAYQKKLRKTALRSDVIKSGINLSRPLKVKLKGDNGGLFVRYTKEGKVEGITPEILFEVCDVLQVRCQVVSDEYESWSSMITSLEENSVDILGPMSVTEKRKEQYNFSNPYYTQQSIMVKRKRYKDDVYNSVSEMFAERIGVVADSFHDKLLTDFFEGLETKRYSSFDELLKALVTKDIDYAFVTRSAFNRALVASEALLPITEESSLGTIYQYPVGFGFADNEKGARLATLFSDALELIHVNKIIEKHDVPPDWYETLVWQNKLRNASAVGFMIIGIAFLWAIYFFYSKSTTDELTELKNRLALYKRYGKKLPKSYSLVYLDVNKFKYINDTFGHAIGDKALIVLAGKIKKYWKGQAYRIGGDEFVLIYRGSPEQIDQMLSKINPYRLCDEKAGVDHEVTLSIGIAKAREQHQPIDTVLHTADQSMYRSKSRFRHASRD